MNATLLQDQLERSRQTERREYCESVSTFAEIEEIRDDCLVTPPTPEEIRQRCEEIQREWTPRERYKRAGYRHDPTQWHPPLVHAGEVEMWQ